jgi:hypothetical protein
MRLHTVALTRIEADQGAFRTHLGAYQFIETRLAETIRVDPGGFARILTVVGAWPSIRHCSLRRRLLKNNGDFHYTQYIYFYILNYSSCLIIYISDGTR